MPTYDYVCDACDHKFELFQGINDPIKKKCPECGKSKLRRLFGTGGAIMFKGSGFYQTDYRSDSYKSKAAADKPSDGKSSETKSESKSESKSGDSKPAESKSTDSRKNAGGGSKPEGKGRDQK
ncbi:MAG TPA: zinc ribbon domain-containing protein [Pirellulales bacterium]|jgi:putative FmdB family regulatory protein|nr:zinc ribbon domain-containing protein [Pirellulales bacterium]